MAEKVVSNSTASDMCCVVCGKKNRIMKRCGRCHLVFYCSVECQQFDWITHRATCYTGKIQKSDNTTVIVKTDKTAATIGHEAEAAICKTIDNKEAKNREEHKYAGQGLDSNVKQLRAKCDTHTLTSSHVNNDHGVEAIIENDGQKLCHQKKNEGEFTELKENGSVNKGPNADVQNLSGDSKIEENLYANPHNDVVVVYVKYAKVKHKVEINFPCMGHQALEHFSRVLHIPLERLKLIHKGQLQTQYNIMERLKQNSVYLAFGEMNESEDGLEAEDIELIMKQLSVERNVAIRALRKTNCVIDAILEIGNDM